MKRFTTAIVALFGLLMTAVPGVAGADVAAWGPQNLQPVVIQETVAPVPFTTVAYYRPWACANRYFRRHHRWLCR